MKIDLLPARGTHIYTGLVIGSDKDAAREVQDKFAQKGLSSDGASGLAKVTVSGSAERQLAITLDPARMAASGVSAQAVSQALKAAQVDLPVGTTTQSGKTLPVQVVGTAHSAADLQKLVVSGPSAGPVFPSAAPVTLGDVAPNHREEYRHECNDPLCRLARGACAWSNLFRVLGGRGGSMLDTPDGRG